MWRAPSSTRFPLLLLLSLWVFRGLVAAALPLVVGALTILGTFLGLRIVDEFLGISVFALNLVSALGLGLAIDYSLFVLSRYREEVATAPRRAGPIRARLRAPGAPCSTARSRSPAAMASLCVFPLPFLYSMGLGGAFTALLAGVISLIVLPAALIVVLGPRIDALAPSWLTRKQPKGEPRNGERLLVTPGANAVMRRPGAVAMVTTVRAARARRAGARAGADARLLEPPSSPHPNRARWTKRSSANSARTRRCRSRS